MTIIRLAHYAIHTSDLEASRRFYTEVMGFRVGYRPSLPFPGIWPYQHEDQSEFGIVHIMGLNPDDPKNLEGYWGIGSNEPRSGTDSFDHIAFLAKDWSQMRTAAKLIGSTMWSEAYPSSVCSRSFWSTLQGSH